mgnify:FL=1
MKQLIINQLEGGFVVQQVVDGQQGVGVVRTNFGQVIKEGRKFFELEMLNGKSEDSDPQALTVPFDLGGDSPPGDSPPASQEERQPVPRVRPGRPRLQT